MASSTPLLSDPNEVGDMIGAAFTELPQVVREFQATASMPRNYQSRKSLKAQVSEVAFQLPPHESSTALNRVAESFMQYGAVVMTWILGACGTLYLLSTFEEALKPMVMALIFVSCLEFVVQSMEMVFIYVGIVAKCVLKKFALSVCISCKLMAKICKVVNVEQEWKQLQNMEELNYRWSPSHAGKYTLPRVLSVILCIFFISVGAGLLYHAVITMVHTIIADADMYTFQVQRLMTVCQIIVKDLPDHLHFLTHDQREQARQVINDSLALWSSTKGQASVLSWLQNTTISYLNSVVAGTSNFLYQFMFFLLYAFLFLFSPLHISPEESQDDSASLRSSSLSKGESSSSMTSVAVEPVPSRRRKSMRRRASTVTAFSERLIKRVEVERTIAHSSDAKDQNFVDTLDAATTELQSHVHNILWNYFALLSFVNFLFAFCVELALHLWLKVQLGLLCAIACFFLAFIPELGAIIAVILPVPIILLSPSESDRIDGVYNFSFSASNSTSGSGIGGKVTVEDVWPGCYETFQTALYAVLSMFAIKLVVGNWLSSVIMGRNRALSGAIMKNEMAEIQETHPAAVLFAVIVAGQIWGPMGMIISVPVLSLFKCTINIYEAKVEAARMKAEAEVAKAREDAQALHEAMDMSASMSERAMDAEASMTSDFFECDAKMPSQGKHVSFDPR